MKRLALAGVIALAACAGGEPVRDDAAPARAAITGGWPGSRSDAIARPLPGANRLLLRQPVGVAAAGNEVVIVDAGLRQLLRYDLTLDTLTPLASFATLHAEPVGLAIGPERSIYVADPGRRRVLRYARDGRLLQTFFDDVHLVRPSAVVVDNAGNVIVADRSLRQLVYFNPLGATLRVVDAGAGFSAVGALAGDAARAYLLDPQGRRVLLLQDARVAQTIDLASIRLPGALAVDRDGTLFVAERADNTVRALREGREVARYARANGAPFADISALAVDEGRLYVADRVAGRVHVLALPPLQPKGG